MSDRELLEKAAKAAGYDDAKYEFGGEWMEVRYGIKEAIWSDKYNDETGAGYWNPLEEDGSALRLAVKLQLDIEFINDDVIVLNAAQGGGDPYERTRRAIVRAAAALAK